MVLAVGLPAGARNERDTLNAGPAACFVENLGQWDLRVKYEMQLHDAAVFLEEDGMMVALREHLGHPGGRGSGGISCHAYRIRFAGAQATVPIGVDRQEGYSNFFLGDDRSRWRSRVGSYLTARYDGLYPGVALEVFGGKGALKYNLIVAPGADATRIYLEYEGPEDVSVERNGNLVVRTSVRDVVELKPYVYQRVGGGERVVGSRWRVSRVDKDRWRVWVELGEYDHGEELVIDPLLIFSTYSGSTADNWGTTAAYDSEKNCYTAGLVFGVGYPVSTGAYQEAPGGSADVGIFKFDSTGSTRLYATYLGGSSADMPHSLFVNSFDELIVFGTTGSDDFPTSAGAYQTQHGGGPEIDYESNIIRYTHGSDIFVSRLSADGSQLRASTYMGGSDNDGLNYRNSYNPHYNGYNYRILMGGNDSLYYNYGDGARGEIITDNLNNIYVGSTTMSSDFPTTGGCVQPAKRGRQEGVVFKLDHNLRNLLWSTYLGGSMDDAVYSIDVDSAYNLIVCGGTNSVNFPVTDNVWQHAYGGGSADGFISKISYNGDRLMASTFMGNRFYDQLYFVRTGRHDEVFVFGQTQPAGNSNMIFNAGYSVYNSGMLLARLQPDLSDRVWSTLFGTPGRINLSPTAFAADICNRVYAAGWGRDFVPYIATWDSAGTTGMETTPDAWSDSTDGQDFYIMSIDADANHLDYATFFGELHTGPLSYGGEDHVDGGTSRFDRHGTLYQSVCGSCNRTQGFPITSGAWSDSNMSSNCNNALFRFNVTDDFPVAEFIPPVAGCAPYAVTFRNTGRGTSFLWDFGDGTTSTQRNPSHTYDHGGIYTVTLVAMLPGGCSVADTQRHTVHVIGDGAHSFAPSISCAGVRIQIGMKPQIGTTYQWLTEGVSDASVANPWVSEAGVYLLQVSAPGCSEVDTFEVRTYALVDLWQSTAISCHDSADGSAWFRLGEGIDPDSVSATVVPPASLVFDGDRTYWLRDLPAGTYHVTFDGYGCQYESEVVLANPEPPYYEKEASGIVCNDSCEGWIHIRYNLSAIPEIPPMDTLISGLCVGTYVTNLTSLGCPLTDTTEIVRSHSLDGFKAWADDTILFLGQSVMLHSTEIEGATYSWTPSTDLETPTAAVTRATPVDSVACYLVSVHNLDGCTATDSVCIRCTSINCGEPDFVIPNAFTPDGDGINDEVDFSSRVLADIKVAIFNRWGECVFECNDTQGCRWDGTFRNEKCLPGVYTYTCHIRCHNGEENDLKGNITLIR